MNPQSDLARFGSCSRCRWQTLVTSGRGSTFSLCEKSKADPRFARYPQVPVASCPGFEPRPAGGTGAPPPPAPPRELP